MRNIPFLVLLAAILACNDEPRVTEPAEPLAGHTSGGRYRVEKYSSTLGGAISVATSINIRGRLAGFSDLAGGTRHAVLWRHGRIQDLGTLGGPNSNVQWPGQNDRGMVVGIAETADMDPNREPWSCSAFFPGGVPTYHVCRGFAYYGGRMHELPTLGGTHGFATAVNTYAQVVGWAETAWWWDGRAARAGAVPSSGKTGGPSISIPSSEAIPTSSLPPATSTTRA